MEGEEGERAHKKEAFFHGWGRPTLRCPPGEKRSCCSIDEGGSLLCCKSFPPPLHPRTYLVAAVVTNRAEEEGQERPPFNPLPLDPQRSLSRSKLELRCWGSSFSRPPPDNCACSCCQAGCNSLV